MAVVVSDTTPLNYLILIEAIDVLPRLYGRVLIPAVVWDELAQPETPKPVLNWLAQTPSWLEVTNPMASADPTLSHLDEGEAQAIILAMERRADLLLLDERDGTAAARALGLTVTGTLGILDWAASRGFVDLPTMFARLRDTTFRSPVGLMATMLEQDAIRRERQRQPKP
jgi:predicted nucleic acid-binding protein